MKSKPKMTLDRVLSRFGLASRAAARDAIRMGRIKLNGRVVAEHAGDPQRSKAGPIGLQMHDQFSIVMFRNVRILEIGK